LQTRFETFLKRNNNSELARKVVEDNQAEIDLYQKFKDYYSYGFYIAKKNDLNPAHKNWLTVIGTGV